MPAYRKRDSLKPLKDQVGFTLIEVMTALVILSITVTALSSAVSQSTNNISQLKQKQFANWVAHNQMSLYMLGELESVQGSSRFADINYRWKLQVSNTQTANFNKIELTVTTEANPEYTQASITAYKGVK